MQVQSHMDKLELLKELRWCGNELVFACDVESWSEVHMYLNRIIKTCATLQMGSVQASAEAQDPPKPKVDIDLLMKPPEARNR